MIPRELNQEFLLRERFRFAAKRLCHVLLITAPGLALSAYLYTVDYNLATGVLALYVLFVAAPLITRLK